MNKIKTFHFLFEQSGTFKNQAKKLGFEAYDYDIQDDFGETDFKIDLFHEIEEGYENRPSIFDKFGEDDFVMAFFPCIEFAGIAQVWYSLTARCYAKWTYKDRIEYMVKKNRKRANMYELLMKFCSIFIERGIRMVFENPWSMNTYLKQNVFLKSPSLIDLDRTKRGDHFKKPTAYWFWNCEPSNGQSYQQTPPSEVYRITDMKVSSKAGICSKERSMISPDYARNFLCDFILGLQQP